MTLSIDPRVQAVARAGWRAKTMNQARRRSKGYLIAGNAAPKMDVLGPGRIAWRKDVLHTDRRHR
jgi:hypothetical protein